MRPGQNNKRMRGRNNRKSPNPLTRSYESNGPDVKIRGTAHHVAEKYLQLARDAQSSGDPVMAESYLQHAEHYFRLIAAAQAAQQQAQTGYQRSPNDPVLDDDDDDDDFGGLPDRFASPPERFTPPPQPYAGQPQAMLPSQPQQQPQPQPYQERGAYNGDRPYNQDRGQQQDRQQHQDRSQQGRGDRPHNQDRNNQNRFNQNRGPRDNRPQREFRNDPQPRVEVPPAVAEEVGLPSFITTPLRPVPAAVPAPAEAEHNGGADHAQEEPRAGGYHLRPRRRRSRPDQVQGSEELGVSETPASAHEPSLFGEN